MKRNKFKNKAKRNAALRAGKKRNRRDIRSRIKRKNRVTIESTPGEAAV